MQKKLAFQNKYYWQQTVIMHSLPQAKHLLRIMRQSVGNNLNHMTEIYDWTKFRKSKIHEDILNRWKNLLANEALNEQDYHSFLQLYPAIFFTITNSYIVISKLKLGSEYETDFVVVHEGYSNGTEYEIIEIESPHTKLFDSKGKPSSKLNAALQQIRDWRRWLIDNRNQFHKIFPTSNTKVIKDSKLRFKIIIGRRTSSQLELERRRQIEEEMNIEIISFDRLTDLAIDKRMFLNETTLSSAQKDFNVSAQKDNELANPFYECIKDSDWRSICSNGHSHIHTGLIDEILKVRKYNEDFGKYKKAYKA